MNDSLENQKLSLFRNIEYLQYLICQTECPHERFYYQQILQGQLNYLSQIESLILTRNNHELPYMSLEELAKWNGENGKKAYVAINGFVYDVTDIASWKDSHFGLRPGLDLTKEFLSCHNNELILMNLPKVARLS